MCGLFGLVAAPWRAGAAAALDALAPRGPDGAGEWSDEHAWLGHRRLAVIDPAGGHQPMVDAASGMAIVFNGEIYNFAALRRELEARGRRFVTRSDTEVLLAGYAEWGRELLPRLDGMFAFAVWEPARRRLFAARDRLGVKPFFYSTVRGFAFASTLKPFLVLEGFPRRLDYEALRDYLGFQCVSAPLSFLREVRQLPPAHWLDYRADDGVLALGRYWEIPPPTETPPPREALLARVDAALAASVRDQLVADVPLGAFLSGGIDSSLVVHYMAQAAGAPPETFSVRFREEGFDETPAAAAVAAQVGARHHVLDAPDIDADTFLTAIRALDQPLADPAYVMTSELARLTRRHVTVALSGDGGDELFGGYPRFLDQEADHPPGAIKVAARRLVEAGWLPGAALRRTLAGRELLLYRKLELGPWRRSRKSLAAFLVPEALAAARPEGVLRDWQALASSFSGRWDTASLMRADLWSYLSENCLAKSDRASMNHGLEVRVPLLGNAVLDAVLRLPTAPHFDPGGKALLRELARRHLPEAVWKRPKHGFSVPLGSYFGGAWRPVLEAHFARAAELAPFLRPQRLRWLTGELRAGRARRLGYAVLVLLVWLDAHGIDLAPDPA